MRLDVVVCALCIALCYVAYVVVTHADGVAFATAIGAISALLSYRVGRERGYQTGLSVTLSPRAAVPSPENGARTPPGGRL
jgi:hypothetical protein